MINPLTPATDGSAPPGTPPWAAAAAFAGKYLAGLDPDTAAAHRLTIAAALRYSQVAADPQVRFAWACYAYRASRDLYGPGHQTCVTATTVYTDITADPQLCFGAPGPIAVADRPVPASTLIAAQRHRAEALHADLRCADAEDRARDALRLWHSQPGQLGEGRQVLVSYAAILAGCGRVRDAGHVLRGHPDLLPATAAGAQHAAARIVAAELQHPPRCARHPSRQPLSPTAALGRLAAWQHLLEPVTPCAPAGPTGWLLSGGSR